MKMELQNIQEFKSTPTIIDKLLSTGLEKFFSSGEIIINENAFVNSIPIVKDGCIKVMRTDDDGKEILLYYIKPGDCCIMGFLGSLNDQISRIKATADGDTTVLFVPVTTVAILNREHPEWLDYIFRIYYKCYDNLLEVVNAIAFKKMDERILASVRQKVEMAQNDTIFVTHEQLALELGTARVVVSRLLKQMEDEGFVQLGRNKIKLLEKGVM
jgi:CRP/FNR family transcriptional regulator